MAVTRTAIMLFIFIMAVFPSFSLDRYEYEYENEYNDDGSDDEAIQMERDNDFAALWGSFKNFTNLEHKHNGTNGTISFFARFTTAIARK